MIKTMRFRHILVLALSGAAIFSTLYAGPPRPTPVYGYRVVHVYPHDPNAFTQGLEYRGGFLYEGTGLRGRSSLRKTDLASGRVIHETPLDAHYFGEGITVASRRIVELTWQSHRGFIYDRNTFQPVGSFEYARIFEASNWLKRIPVVYKSPVRLPCKLDDAPARHCDALAKVMRVQRGLMNDSPRCQVRFSKTGSSPQSGALI